MWRGRLLRACLVASLCLLAVTMPRDRRRPRPISIARAATTRVRRSLPAIRRIARWCASATGVAGPGASTIRPTCRRGAVCWLKNTVPARTEDSCCVSGVRGAGVVEPRNSAIETSIDRFGGDYRNFDLKSGEGDEACKAACAADNKCRAWTYARPGLCRQGGALLPEKGDQAAAAQGRVYLGRGAVGTASLTPLARRFARRWNAVQTRARLRSSPCGSCSMHRGEEPRERGSRTARSRPAGCGCRDPRSRPRRRRGRPDRPSATGRRRPRAPERGCRRNCRGCRPSRTAGPAAPSLPACCRAGRCRAA